MTTDTTGHAPTSTTPMSPVPQRGLRAHRPPRPSDRAAVSAEHLGELSRRLTARDRWLAHLLLEHRVLTSTQIVQLGFGIPRTANLRLAKLYQWRVIDRFQPFAERGSAPMHYVLDLAGAHILAATWGFTPADLGYRHDRAIAISHSLRLAHTVAATGIYTALVAIARHSGPHSPDSARDGGGSPRQVTAWWSESRCACYFGTHVRPDGYGRWREAGRQIEFFLEYDFGTEPLAKVADKLADYHRLAHATGLVTPVLFWFPTPERETHARAALATALAALPAHPDALVPIATTSSLPADPSPPSGLSIAVGAVSDSPAAARWLPVNPASSAQASAKAGATHRLSAARLRLAQLTTAWPTLARPVTAAEGPSGSAPRAARVIRSDSAGHRNAAAAKGSWPAPGGMPPGPNDQGVGRDQRAVA